MKKTPKSKKPIKLIVRIVSLAALTAFAASTRAQVTVPNDIRAETAWFVAVGQRGNSAPESFVVPVSGAARIAEVRQYLADRAENREKRPLIPTVALRLGSDGENRNHSAPGAPLWNWHVREVRSLERYTRPEVEPAVFIATRDSTPSEVETLLRGTPLSLPSDTFALRDYPIMMELKSEFPRATLANVSDRGYVGAGNAAKITGFIVDGGTPRNVVIRALGPSLAAFGVEGAIANPKLEVYRGTEKVAENDDWAQGNLNRPHAAVYPAPPPFHLIPGDARDAAIELTLVPGAYTIVVTGVDGATGIVLTDVHTL